MFSPMKEFGLVRMAWGSDVEWVSPMGVIDPAALCELEEDVRRFRRRWEGEGRDGLCEGKGWLGRYFEA